MDGGGGAPWRPCLTFTLEPLPQQPPQQRATVVAEGEHLEVVDAELVRHVDAEPLRTDWLHSGREETSDDNTTNTTREGQHSQQSC